MGGEEDQCEDDSHATVQSVVVEGLEDRMEDAQYVLNVGGLMDVLKVQAEKREVDAEDEKSTTQ